MKFLIKLKHEHTDQAIEFLITCLNAHGDIERLNKTWLEFTPSSREWLSELKLAKLLRVSLTEDKFIEEQIQSIQLFEEVLLAIFIPDDSEDSAISVIDVSKSASIHVTHCLSDSAIEICKMYRDNNDLSGPMKLKIIHHHTF